ncbi:MAG: HlyC/CorC family transporter [Proteobacteria bacterium]|nr:HlyC/CorC family transporter [Pseudomonadota bacterium]MDA0994011.1 HlyC/CorC family transporter [Pseudomonadota bacterium]
MGNDISLAAMIGLLVVLLILSAFFSGSETALMSLNRYKLRHKARAGHRGAKLAESLLQRPDRLIGLILLGNNAVNISASALVGVVSVQLGGEIGFAIGTAALTLIVLIFAETAPKTAAALHPERFAYPAAYIYYPLLKILYPLVWATNVMANTVLLLLGLRSTDADRHALSREELRTLVYETGARISGKYRQMLLSILDLEKVSVDDVMVPHNEIIGIDMTDDISEISQIISNSQHTRLPVYNDDIDNVLGILHLRRLANISTRDEFTKDDIRGLLDDPYFVPEGTPLSTQLLQFQKGRRRFALVVDEYGDIQGIVTLEDILEEIVGEFTTDPANDDDEIVKETDRTWLVSGTANVRDMNRVMGWDLPTDGPKTVNGLVLEYLESIPESGTCLKIGEYPIEIIEAKENRVQLARIYLPETDNKP